MPLYTQASNRLAVQWGLDNPLDGITIPKYKLLHFFTTKKNCKEKKALALNQDRCCHLVLCLQLILFHFITKLYIFSLQVMGQRALLSRLCQHHLIVTGFVLTLAPWKWQNIISIEIAIFVVSSLLRYAYSRYISCHISLPVILF